MRQQNNITVVHIIKGLGRGGAERLLVSTIRNHSSTYQFHVVYFLTLKDHLVSELSSAGATVHLISASSPLQMFLKLPALLRLLRLIRPNLLHAHLPLSGAVAALASWVLGLPLVYTEHNLPSRYHRPTQFIHFFTVRRALKLLCVSRVVLNDLTDRYNVKSKTTLLENGVDTELFNLESFDKAELRKTFGISEQALVVGTVAVFTPQKRLDRWLQICREVSERNPTVTFILSGHGPLMEQLKVDAADLLKRNAIVFTDRTSVPEKWMATMDVYLMSSDYEGLPLALLEAMSLSLPVVATSVGGIPTVIDHGVNGFLVQPDDVGDAVDTIEKLLADQSLRSKIGFAARTKIVQQFGIHRMVQELEQVYRELPTKNLSA